MMEAVLALQYDPTALTVSSSDIQLGTLLNSGTGWHVQSFINPVTGEVAIDVSSATPLTTQQAGSLVAINFHVRPGAEPGTTPVQLVEAVNPTGQHVFSTEVSDAQGAFVLNPAPGRMGSSGGISSNIVIQAIPPSTPIQQNVIPVASDSLFGGDAQGPRDESQMEVNASPATPLASQATEDEVIQSPAKAITPWLARLLSQPVDALVPAPSGPEDIGSLTESDLELSQPLTSGFDAAIFDQMTGSRPDDRWADPLPQSTVAEQFQVALFAWDDYFAQSVATGYD
jgi:hypothetical protein